MVESGKPKSASSAHRINVSTGGSTTKNASKNITFDEVLDDLKNLDDIENSRQSRDVRKDEPSDSEAPVALTVAPPIGARPGQGVKNSAKASTGNQTHKTTTAKTATKPRPVRTTDGMVSGGAKRTNLAPITKRPLGVPIEQRRVAQQTVSAPKFKVADDEDESEDTFNPLLTAFWTKKRLVIGGVILVALVLVGGVAFVMINKSGKSADMDIADEDTVVDEESDVSVIDYNQAITDINGETLSAKHQLGSEDDLVVLFSDLTCTDSTCSNVSSAKIGSTTLAKGTDYTVSTKDGKLLLTIKATKLNSLKSGAYALVFEMTEGDKVSRIGLRFKVEGNDDQDDTQDDEKPSTNTGSSSNTSNSGSSTSKPNNSGNSNSGNTNTGGSTGGTGNTGNTGNSGSSGNNGNSGNTGGDTGNSGGDTNNPGTGDGDGDSNTGGDDTGNSGGDTGNTGPEGDNNTGTGGNSPEDGKGD